MDVGTAKEEISSAELRGQHQALVVELRDAMSNGKSAEVLRIQALLRDIPANLIAAEARELREELDRLDVNLQTLRAEEKELFEIKKDKIRILAGHLRNQEEAQEEVNRVQLAQEMLKAEQIDTRQRRKELAERQKEIMNKIEEVTKDEYRAINGS